MTALRGTSLVAATIGIGVMAGVFFTYAVAVMPGLGRTDDRTFVGAFPSIDRSIESSPTFLAMFGGLGSAVLAAALHLSVTTSGPCSHGSAAPLPSTPP